ncbi:MAG: hypothetical protein JRN20_21895, partial [Nitrososphaerota archaeon]|nr:hypothetical protein [Nitrososphaerota archaeon]
RDHGQENVACVGALLEGTFLRVKHPIDAPSGTVFLFPPNQESSESVHPGVTQQRSLASGQSLLGYLDFEYVVHFCSPKRDCWFAEINLSDIIVVRAVGIIVSCIERLLG